MPDAKLSTAYAGSAPIKEENAVGLLNNFLPDKLGWVFIPERVPRKLTGLKTVIAFLESEVGDDGTIPVADPIKALLDKREAEGDDLALIMLFDPESEEDVALAKRAFDAGIKVYDLAAAGDELVLADSVIEFEFEEEEEVTEPELETPPFDVESAATDLAVPAAPVSSPVDTQGIVINFNFPPEAVTALARAIVRAMTEQATASLDAAGDGLATVSPIASGRSASKPPGVGHARRAGVTEQPPGTKAFYHHADTARYRPARGIAKEGEVKVYLTKAEEAEARAKHMLG